ncbi:MAG: restriction system-associated AAA family ATPase [Bacteroides sp.]|nr:restriction system-associated AAA family ATPase [Bacteroides sp.]
MAADKQFRSLYPGFEVVFRLPQEESPEALDAFNPFCLAGLNGTGKSNVLEALAAIFFHLECCVARFRPQSFKTFDPAQCHPCAFTLEYLIQRSGERPAVENFDRVLITKEEGCPPRMQVKPFTGDAMDYEEISLKPYEENGFPKAAPGKAYLPDIVIGYSSGENEILSIPFLKSRLINYDKYRQDYFSKYRYERPENSLIYIDEGMSQAVLLSCLLFEEQGSTLQFLIRELKLLDIVSFRMNINVQLMANLPATSPETAPVTAHIASLLEEIKKSATCWFEDPRKEMTVLTLDFLVNKETRTAFRKLFRNSFDCFRFFQMLYELNACFLDETMKREVYQSKGIYTQGKLPQPDPQQDVFHFLDFLILKEVRAGEPPKELLLKEFSDGEHQFLHTMGMCLMLKEERTLLLLDEPETHFNPGWRSRFIQILDESIDAGGGNNLQKEIVLTSHSPFILSDCRPEKVLIFEKDGQGKATVAKAWQKGWNTYGMSVNLLTARVFKQEKTIGEYAQVKVEKYRNLLKSGVPLE